MFDELLQGLAGISPVIATIIGGPVGTVVGFGIKMAAQLLTGSNDPKTVIQAIKDDPSKLQELENRSQELHVQQLQALLADTQDARKTMVSNVQSKSLLSWAPVIISCLVVALTVLNSWQLFSVIRDHLTVDAQTFQLLIYVEGVLTAAFTQTINFWLGSSSGSKDKDAAITQQLAIANVAEPKVIATRKAA